MLPGACHISFNPLHASGDLSSADNLCKQFGSRSTEYRYGYGSKLFDSDSVPETLFEEVNFEQNLATLPSMQKVNEVCHNQCGVCFIIYYAKLVYFINLLLKLVVRIQGNLAHISKLGDLIKWLRESSLVHFKASPYRRF